jgi:enoyl-CoA hydratase
VEGIRAAVVDKDRNPKWRPATLAEVTDAHVDAFLAEPAPRIPFCEEMRP